jgi:hypothetical protein
MRVRNLWDWLLKKDTPELLDFVTMVAGALGAVILHAAR